jgi:hypothetical protein
MDSVEGSIAVEDVNGDGALDMIAVDAKGNVFCFDKHGEEIWENHVSGFVSVHPTIGDINGDGILDVVLATSDGSVWALRGDTGAVLPRFPLKTGGAIMAPVTLVNLDVEQGVRTPGLHLVFASHDGYVYIVDGRNICANKFDLSEKTFAQILVDDVMGRGKMDLVVATMNGNVFCLATEAPFTPLKAWPSSTHALNGFTAREDYLGVYIADETKQHIEVVGNDFQLIFTIIDARPSTVRTTDTEPVHYHVTLALGRKQILLQETYTAPGTYQVTIAAIHEPSVRSLRLTMVNEHGQVFEDSLTLEFNVHYYKLLKWVVTFPLLILVAILYIFKTDKGPAFDFYL